MNAEVKTTAFSVHHFSVQRSAFLLVDAFAWFMLDFLCSYPAIIQGGDY
jgi:hypothetical protein